MPVVAALAERTAVHRIVGVEAPRHELRLGAGPMVGDCGDGEARPVVVLVATLITSACVVSQQNRITKGSVTCALVAPLPERASCLVAGNPGLVVVRVTHPLPSTGGARTLATGWVPPVATWGPWSVRHGGWVLPALVGGGCSQ